MTGFGWRYPFRDQGWASVRERLEAVNWANGEADHIFEIIDAVVESDAGDLLAVDTSMHDVLVVPKPIPEPPLDVLRVCAPSSPLAAQRGTVRMIFLAVSGRNTEIDRPVAETLPLFWRFLDVEFGISPSRAHPASTQPANSHDNAADLLRSSERGRPR